MDRSEPWGLSHARGRAKSDPEGREPLAGGGWGGVRFRADSRVVETGVVRPCGRLFAQVGTGTRDPVTRSCAMFSRAFGEITNPSEPSPFVRELGRHSFE